MEKISFVVPVYNSENTIYELCNRINNTIKSIGDVEQEIILINDNSKDNSLKICSELALSDSKIKVICFSKNFGKHHGLMAGYKYCEGDYIVTLDDDLQNPPEEFTKLFNEIKRYDYDVLFGVPIEKKHNNFQNFGSNLNKKMAEYLIGKPKNLRLSSFWIMKKYIVNEMLKYTNPYPYVDGLILRITDNIGNTYVRHDKRVYGKSNFNFVKLLKLWMNGFTAFSVKPLRIATVLGFVCALAGFVFGGYTIVNKLLHPQTPAGYSSTMAALLFIGGMIMLMLGLIGEYVGRIYISINNSPQYVIRETINIDVKK